MTLSQGPEAATATSDGGAAVDGSQAQLQPGKTGLDLVWRRVMMILLMLRHDVRV